MEKKRSCSDFCCSVLEERYETVRELREGGRGIVMLCRERASGRLVACKTASAHKKNMRRKLDAKKKKALNVQDDLIRWEAEVLGKLKGQPGIVPLEATLTGEDGCIHLLTSYCEGGDLLAAKFILDGERQAARVLASLAGALASCHKLGLVHSDVKPQNVFVQRKEGGEEEEALLGDFGLAAYISPGESLSEPVGSSYYMAPEVIHRHYDHRADIWSLGVTLHLLLTGSLPFMYTLDSVATDAAVRNAVLQNALDLDPFMLSPGACNILKGMLCKDPVRRLTLQQISHHPWVIRNNSVARFWLIPCPGTPPAGDDETADLSHCCTTLDAAAHPAKADEDDNPPRKVRATMRTDCDRQYRRAQRIGKVADPAVC